MTDTLDILINIKEVSIKAEETFPWVIRIRILVELELFDLDWYRVYV